MPPTSFKTTRIKTGHPALDSDYTLASTGQAEDAEPTDGPIKGDNPKSSETTRQGNGASLIDGPFGGKHPA